MADFPRPIKSFDRNAYRSTATYNAHRAQTQGQGPSEPSEPSKPIKSFNKNAYRDSRTYSSSKGKARANQNQQGRTSQASRTSQKLTTSDNKDELHFMSDEEVAAWFREANEEYEADKRAGRFDNYVPAGGVPPKFSNFMASNNDPKPKGLANSMYANKSDKADEAAESSKQ